MHAAREVEDLWLKEEDKIQVEGTIIEALPATRVSKVRLDNGHEILAYLSGQNAKILYPDLIGGPGTCGNISL